MGVFARHSDFTGRHGITSHFRGYSRTRITPHVLTMLALLAPFRVQAQCHPAEPGQPKPSASDASSPASPQFYDEPRFTVAGVADTTNLGGHGSDTVVRTKEALAKDTA